VAAQPAQGADQAIEEFCEAGFAVVAVLVRDLLHCGSRVAAEAPAVGPLIERNVE